MKNQRKRHNSDQTDEKSVTLQTESSVTREQERKPVRPPRVQMSGGTRLHYHHKDPNYHYAWIQDRDGKLDQAIQAYYEFVQEDGQKVTRASGPYPLFLMQLENKYWKEDEKLKYDKTCDSLKDEQALGPGEYLPDGRNHALEKDDYDPLA